MLTLDHLVVVAPSLAEGADHVRERLGLDMADGGAHPEMGTHNQVLRLGDDTFLEVIAVDPAAAVPATARWFGLGDARSVRAAWEEGRRLRCWVARTSGLDIVLARHDALLGRATRVSRGGRAWRFAVRPDGSLPADGAAPQVIDWEGRGSPVAAMADRGARLAGFVLEHPQPAEAEALLRSLGASNGPHVRLGPTLRYRARIATPGGERELV